MYKLQACSAITLIATRNIQEKNESLFLRRVEPVLERDDWSVECYQLSASVDVYEGIKIDLFCRTISKTMTSRTVK